MEDKSKNIKIAAVGDLHIRESDQGNWVDYFQGISQAADILLICGDLTDTGDDLEATILAKELKACTIPVVAVLGNHDYEKGRQKLIREIMLNNDIHVLDGEAITIAGIGFAGIKGFGGGFDGHMLSLFGEEAMKAFVQEAVNEALQLDRALARLDQDHPGIKKIALMHYSPIKETVMGESKEIFPFLGSSRLVEPLQRRNVIAAFHGHAHVGRAEGVTKSGVRVFNVALPVLIQSGNTQRYFAFEIEC